MANAVRQQKITDRFENDDQSQQTPDSERSAPKRNVAGRRGRRRAAERNASTLADAVSFGAAARPVLFGLLLLYPEPDAPGIGGNIGGQRFQIGADLAGQMSGKRGSLARRRPETRNIVAQRNHPSSNLSGESIR